MFSLFQRQLVDHVTKELTGISCMHSPHAKRLPLPSVPSSTPPGVSGTKSPALLTGRFQMDGVIVTSLIGLRIPFLYKSWLHG